LRNKARRIPILRRIILFLNILAVIALVVVYLGTQIRPIDFWPLAFAGLTYPFIVTANLLFVIYWLLVRRWYFIISLVFVLAGWNQLRSFIGTGNYFSSQPENADNIKVASYNVQVFGLYNYGPGWKLNLEQRNSIFRFLEHEDFDIICFQEFVHDATEAFKTLDTIPSILRAKYYHTGFTMESHKINFFGLATFSAYPIINKGEIKFRSLMGNHCIYSDIKIGNDTIRVYNVHFESIGLSSEDFMFVDDLNEPLAKRQNIISGTVNLLQRIRAAFLYRTRQVEIVAEHISNSPYPVILAGDFNDTPASWAYNHLRSLLKDSFTSGFGTGFTHNGRVPALRIDYIMHSHHFSSQSFVTGNQKYSDHYPLWTTLSISNQSK
jgi:endonuclease/exonuclease/phosphatase family metal-dependent hydrolase